ncbi:FHA domain-containing protein [Microbacterium sp.]|uniref:FHA domain-containing protein n=1 Tax=Microbacterium sp. TaxID=51671 RepID=UPI0028122016|nr:FHA domain-containing protein [Microbacterium sp.]
MDEQTQGYQPTTTHAEWGAGKPHLLISRGDDERMVYDLTSDEVTIGSAAGSSVLLEGADPVHATIVHDDRDEYVLTLHGAGEMNANADEGPEGERTEILRTGARFTIGDWTLVFGRQEFADHGRPYGGRQGGELSDQPPQPQRPDYRADRSGEERPRGEEVRDG